jgi:hypothetical protein
MLSQTDSLTGRSKMDVLGKEQIEITDYSWALEC